MIEPLTVDGATLHVLSSVDQVAASEWDALHTDDDSPFVEHAFLSCLERAGCAAPERGWTPSHLVWRKNNAVILALPAYEKMHSEGEFVFDWGWADAAMRAGIEYYPKLVVAVPFTPVTGRRLLRHASLSLDDAAKLAVAAIRHVVAQRKLSSAHVLFPHQAECDALERRGLARREGVQFHWNNEGYASFDDFLARFQAKKRAALKRERAQVAKDAMRIETLRGASLDPSLAPEIHRLYRTTVDKFTWGRAYLNERFFRALLERWRDRVEWVRAVDASGAVIAGAFNASRGKKLYGRYWGAFEERAFLHFNVCYYHSIDDAIARGMTVFEPGAGGEHKLARGFDPTRTFSAHWIEDDRLDRAVRAFLAREVPAIRAAIEREHAESPLRRKGNG
ncbi:MAG: GNAT family N-acetyltransferase [Myxococcales bacterium]|nr:GNAT family N-acetyltransferase [Myxococcales bacterium]